MVGENCPSTPAKPQTATNSFAIMFQPVNDIEHVLRMHNSNRERKRYVYVGRFWRFFIFLFFLKMFENSPFFSPNLAVLAPEKDSSGDLEEIPQKIVQIDALAATFWAKPKFSIFSIF